MGFEPTYNFIVPFKRHLLSLSLLLLLLLLLLSSSLKHTLKGVKELSKKMR